MRRARSGDCAPEAGEAGSHVETQADSEKDGEGGARDSTPDVRTDGGRAELDLHHHRCFHHCPMDFVA